jgi:hypothetical protein
VLLCILVCRIISFLFSLSSWSWIFSVFPSPKFDHLDFKGYFQLSLLQNSVILHFFQFPSKLDNQGYFQFSFLKNSVILAFSVFSSPKFDHQAYFQFSFLQNSVILDSFSSLYSSPKLFHKDFFRISYFKILSSWIFVLIDNSISFS